MNTPFYPTPQDEASRRRIRNEVFFVNRHLSTRVSHPLSDEYAPNVVIVKRGTDTALLYNNIHCPNSYIRAIMVRNPDEDYLFIVDRLP